MTPHLNEEALVDLLEQSDPDPHIAECVECRESLEEYRAITTCLGQEAAWDLRVLKDEPVPQTIANLRAFADGMRAEDEAAVPFVAELIAGPREEWMPRLLADAKYRTAGVVRKLMEASDKAVDVMPPDALEITALSTEIADKLDPSAYSSDTVMKLRGNAWRDRGYCFYQCSQFRESLDAIKRASALLKDTFVAEYDLARLGILHALVERALDNLGDATMAARESFKTFSDFGETNRLASAAMAESQVLWKSGKTGHALRGLLDVVARFSPTDDDTHARLFANIAWFYHELDNSELALHYYELAKFSSQADGDEVTQLRIDWNIAVLIGRSGNVSEGERRLMPIIKKFEQIGLLSEAAQAGLDLAEFCLAGNRHEEVEALCLKASQFYSEVGLPLTQRALTALAFLREVTLARQLTTTKLRHVRSYLSRLGAQPDLLFVPPPS
jgi:tetratricopeptide (TPR) repeat protein